MLLPVIHPHTHTFNPDTPFPLSLTHTHPHMHGCTHQPTHTHTLTHRYLDRLASSLLQHLKLSQRATSQAWNYTSRKAEAAATAASLEPKLTLFITETKTLQTKVSVAMVTTGNTKLVGGLHLGRSYLHSISWVLYTHTHTHLYTHSLLHIHSHTHTTDCSRNFKTL